MNQCDLKLEIQRYVFAAHDMQLYLDTHPKDEKAFALFKSLTQKANELKEAYVKNFGPLMACDAAEYDKYIWTKGCWPWEKGGNA